MDSIFFDLYDRIAGEIEFCNIAISREAVACCSHGRKPMALLAYIAEVLKGRHERSISLETTYLHFVPSGLSTHYDMKTMG